MSDAEGHDGAGRHGAGNGESGRDETGRDGAGHDGTAVVTVRAPAKVNVQLGVGGLRPDGFHGLANVFLAVGLYDEVTARPADGLTLTVSGRGVSEVPLDDGNLAIRAARLLAKRHGREPQAALHIHKDIPVAGGMAGGSADAAGALLACDALWGTDTAPDELRALGAELGSDVPFALVGDAALGQGRGEVLTPLEANGTFHWVFALADGGLSTPAVYRECDRLREAAGTGASVDSVPEPLPSQPLLDALGAGDAEALAASLSNDLQNAAISLRPSLNDTLEYGTSAGALAALVSGSGPTCAFLAQDAESAARIAAALEASGLCRTARTTTAPAPGARVLA